MEIFALRTQLGRSQPRHAGDPGGLDVSGSYLNALKSSAKCSWTLPPEAGQERGVVGHLCAVYVQHAGRRTRVGENLPCGSRGLVLQEEKSDAVRLLAPEPTPAL